MKDFVGGCQNSSALGRSIRKTLWIISVSRNSIVVIIGMILAYILERNGCKPFKTTGMEFVHFFIFILPLITQYLKCHYKSDSFHSNAA